MAMLMDVSAINSSTNASTSSSLTPIHSVRVVVKVVSGVVVSDGIVGGVEDASQRDR